MREVKKERAILTDLEIERLVACPDVVLELHMLSIVARCEGGVRTSDLHGWDSTMIDRLHFEQCTVPRAKTGTPQLLGIPPVLAPFLRARWEHEGKPESGPVFPARRGQRAGQGKLRGNSYVERLHRGL